MTNNEVLEHENALYDAMINCNIATLDHLLHADLLFVVPSGQTITKEVDLQTYREGSLKINELNPQVEEIRIIEDLAIITLLMDLKGEYNNEPFESKYKYIRFWKQFSDGLKVVGGSGIAL